jgi:hypothetical protein
MYVGPCLRRWDEGGSMLQVSALSLCHYTYFQTFIHSADFVAINNYITYKISTLKKIF